MKRIKLIIEYDGSNYVGWQIQKSGKSIQEEIEKCLKKLFKKNIRLYVAGRTDAGVHALHQVAHFDIDKIEFEISKIAFALNHLLVKSKNSIVILKSEKVSGLFDSRFSVKKKTYLYRILNRQIPSAIISNKAWFVPKEIDIENLKELSKPLIGKFDFNAFRSKHCQSKTSIRSIKHIKIKKVNDCIELRIIGKSFLHNQVRIIVGTLIKISLDNGDAKKIIKILRSKDRKNAGPTAPAHGLYLEKIKY